MANLSQIVASLLRTIWDLLFPPSKRSHTQQGSFHAPTPTAPKSRPQHPRPGEQRSSGRTHRDAHGHLVAEPGPNPRAGAYPGDYRGQVRPQYAPNPDGDPDPGEIVWTWVPFEEDYTRGKDRPVLVIGEEQPWRLAIMLTSKDHTRDHADEVRWGRYWMDIGSGPWDAQGRPSEVRLDRIIRIDPEAMRREGAVMDQDLFEKVVAQVRAHR